MNIGTKDQEIGRLLWESLAAVLVILLLGGIAIVVVRRVMPRIRIASGKRIILRESLSLGPQKMVHLVQVGSRQLLVGTSRDSVSMLTDVTDTLPPEEPTEKPRKKFVIPPIDDVGDAAAADNAGTAGKDA
jgi:flagellar biogenesis protein FliO